MCFGSCPGHRYIFVSTFNPKYPWRLGQGKNFLSRKESLQDGPYILNFEKICIPSLLSSNYFVLSNLLEKMWLCVLFFITSNRKLNLEGSSALQVDAVWKEQNMEKKLILVPPGSIKFIWTSSPPPPPFPCQVLLLAKCLRLLRQKLCFTLHLFYLLSLFYLFKKILTNLFPNKDNFRK